jgi:hypothetical protein
VKILLPWWQTFLSSAQRDSFGVSSIEAPWISSAQTKFSLDDLDPSIKCHLVPFVARSDVSVKCEVFTKRKWSVTVNYLPFSVNNLGCEWGLIWWWKLWWCCEWKWRKRKWWNWQGKVNAMQYPICWCNWLYKNHFCNFELSF